MLHTLPRRLPLVLQLVLLACVLLGLSYTQQMLQGWNHVYGSAMVADQSMNDFMPQWSAGAVAKTNHADTVYDASALHEFYVSHFSLKPQAIVWGYVYPPVTLLLARGFALADYMTSATIFFSVSLLLFLVTAYLWAGWGGVALAFGFSGVWYCLDAGQISLLVGALLGAGLFWLERRPVLAGVLLGLVCIKPQFGILLPLLLLIGGYKKSFAAATVTVLTLVVLSLLLDGPAVWQAFWDKGITNLLNHPYNELMWPRFLTIFGLLAQNGLSPSLAMSVHMISALAAVTLTAHIWWRSPILELRVAAAILASLLISPMFYDYDLPLALVAILALLRCDHRPLLLVSAALLYLLTPFSVMLMPLLFWLLLLQTFFLSHSRTAHA